MSDSNRNFHRKRLGATAAAAVLLVAAIAGPLPAWAAGACALVPNGRLPSQMILQCGQTLTVRPTPGTSYQPLYKKGDPLPVAIRLNDGALLVEFHPAKPREKFQILTPLAIAAVRGTKWAMDVTKAQTSTLVVTGTCGGYQSAPEISSLSLTKGRASTSRRPIRPWLRERGETSGSGRFFLVSESEWRPSGRDLPGS